MGSIILRCIHPLFRFFIPLRKATLNRTRRTVVRFEVDGPTVINISRIKLLLAKLTIFRRDLFALFVEEVIILHGREPRLATPQTTDPHVAVNHLVLDYCVLDTVATGTKYSHVASRYDSTLLMGASLLTSIICSLLLGESPTRRLAIYLTLRLLVLAVTDAGTNVTDVQFTFTLL